MDKKTWLSEARFASWWLTWEDLRWPLPSITEKWEKRAEILARAGVNAVIIFGFHPRWDFLPYFKRVEGILKETAAICHRHGIKVADHHSAVFVHRARNMDDRQIINRWQNHHLPLFPDSWEQQIYRGRVMKDWRMVSAKDNKPIYYEGYRMELFCPNNPDFLKSYCEYTAELVENTGIDALMADDAAFLPDFYSCTCRHCRARFKKETGLDIPDISDKTFWENLDNPDFQSWIEARFRWVGGFYENLRKVLPENILLWSCQCVNLMPHVCVQGNSYEHKIDYSDAVFVEIYHGCDPLKDKNRVVSELCAARSLAKLQGKECIVICYGRKPEDFVPWLKMINRVGARPWVCRMVRDEIEISEEEILKDGYPQAQNPRWPDGEKAVVFSSKIRNRLGPGNDEYYKRFINICGDLWEKNIPFEVLFDNRWPEDISRFEEIYVPMAEMLDASQKQALKRAEKKGAIITEAQ
ncbi:MAG: hypothetical protein JW957_01815 [Candidatus Omnitrophica bacterium]|nr:hypothetical protein [Candidatus Omnitrophota bacterium]